MADRRYVITGGSAAGKTTLLNTMAQSGYRTVEEPGRAIILEQRASGGSALPWGDREAYAQAQWDRHLADYEDAGQVEVPVFFDRGLPDVIGYLRLSGLSVSAELIGEARRLRYAEPVFIAPWWPEIYTRDTERRQSFEEARATCAVMRRTYGELGYETVDLPHDTVKHRLEFVLRHVDRDLGT